MRALQKSSHGLFAPYTLQNIMEASSALGPGALKISGGILSFMIIGLFIKP